MKGGDICFTNMSRFFLSFGNDTLIHTLKSLQLIKLIMNNNTDNFSATVSKVAWFIFILCMHTELTLMHWRVGRGTPCLASPGILRSWNRKLGMSSCYFQVQKFQRFVFSVTQNSHFNYDVKQRPCRVILSSCHGYCWCHIIRLGWNWSNNLRSMNCDFVR